MELAPVTKTGTLNRLVFSETCLPTCDHLVYSDFHFLKIASFCFYYASILEGVSA
jgi:hypothetical protein